MQKLSDFLARVDREDGYSVPSIAHWCPACQTLHQFATDQPQRNGARWTWDANPTSPTFSPSMKITIGPWENHPAEVCHYFLRAGMIQFLPDCTHQFAGQTLPLPKVPALWPAFALRG